MKIAAIETIRLDDFPNLLWAQVHTEDGLVGLGEVFYGAASAEAHIHDVVAPYLLGQNPLLVDRHSRALVGYLGFASTGAETRGNSCVDIALWDIWGQATGQPIHQLLGGASRDAIRVYNTCAGYQYVRKEKRQSTASFALDRLSDKPYEDLDGFLNRADELAHSLLEMGITAMKIWPFDFAAEASGGLTISGPELNKALEPFAKIRKAVGDRMDIMVELHSMWGLTAAKRIARALEQFEPFWFEDPIKMDSLGSLAEFARSTRFPVTGSETLAGRGAFRQLFEMNAVGYAMFDIGWVGGLTEARKIAAMAEAWHLPVVTHDCTGPVSLTVSVHLSLNATNCPVQEMVRAAYFDWYRDLVTDLPPLENGMIRAPEGPGLGTRLLPDVVKRPDAHVRRTTAG